METRFNFRVWDRVTKSLYPVSKLDFFAWWVEVPMGLRFVGERHDFTNNEAESNRFVLMQSTGLPARDSYRGDKLEDLIIFEGDILACPPQWGRPVAVVWRRGGWMIEWPNAGINVTPLFNKSPSTFKWSIVGNIYENPELLTQIPTSKKAVIEIKVPESCVSCPVGHNSPSGSGTYCAVAKEVFPESYSRQDVRAPFCPLVITDGRVEDCESEDDV